MSELPGRAGRDLALPRERGRAALLLAGAALVLAAAPAEAGDATAGRKKAASQCQTCHGIDGLARIPEAPHIAGESEGYLIEQLKAFRSGRRQHPIMSVVAQGLSDEDMGDIAAWYSSISISVEMPDDEPVEDEGEAK